MPQNLLTDLPTSATAEIVTDLLTQDNVRIERIVSRGHASPDGFWYDQEEGEWVVVLKGRARLRIEGEGEDRTLGPSDHLYLAPHTRHRVTWTDPEGETIWLAVFVDPTRV